MRRLIVVILLLAAGGYVLANHAIEARKASAERSAAAIESAMAGE